MKALTYEQWEDRHKNSAKYAKLSKSEKRARFNDYLRSLPSQEQPVPPSSGKSKGGSGAGISNRLGNNKSGKSAAKAGAQAAGFSMSPRTHDLLTARSNPWCPRLSQVGYPIAVPGGSIKWNAILRTTMVCNAAGYGFVMMTPGNAGWPDLNCISYSSSAAFAGATDAFPSTFAPTGCTAAGMTGGPMTFATVNGSAPVANGTFIRLNAAGIRIRSNAALLSKAGSIKTTCLPYINADMFTVTGQQLLTQYPRFTKWFQGNEATSPWFSALWSPALPQGTPGGIFDMFQVEGGMFTPATIAGSGADSAVLGILISGAPNVVFDLDCSVWMEMFGAITTGISYTTPSYADPLGLAVAQGVTAKVPMNIAEPTTNGSASAVSMMSGVLNSAKTVLGNVDMKGYLSDALGAVSGTIPTAQSEPANVPDLQGATQDMGIDATVDDLSARLAGLQMPSVPSAASSSASVEEALAAIGEFAVL